MTSTTTRRHRSLRARIGNAAALVVALAVIGGGYAALAPAGRAASGASSGNQQAISGGKDLFLRSCSSCHGTSAQGTTQAPSLIGVGAAAVDFQVGTGRMPLATFAAQAERKPPRFGQHEIDQLAAYISSLAPGPAVPSDQLLSAVPSASESRGGEYFRTNCAQCHNTQGEGGALAHGSVAPPLSHATPKQIYEAMLTGPEQMPVFPDREVTPTQKLDIIKYLQVVNKQGINPGGQPIGRIGPVSEGLVAWVVGLGACVLITLWIGARA